MKKQIRSIILCTILLFQPCSKMFALGVDFIEKGYFNSGGSGKFSFTVDLSKTSAIISLLQYINKDYRKTTKIIGYDAFLRTKKYLKAMEGISNVRMKHNDRMLKFTLSFQFQDIEALNSAMQQIHRSMDPPSKIIYFSFNDHVFVREDINSIARKLIRYTENDDSLVKSLDLNLFFKDITYTVIYFFDQKIKEITNPLSVISKSRKSVKVRHHVLNRDEVPHSIRNRIYF